MAWACTRATTARPDSRGWRSASSRGLKARTAFRLFSDAQVTKGDFRQDNQVLAPKSLTQLFQDGLVNLAVQALTLIVVTVIIFTLNVQLALITVVVVVPVMLGLTLWFRAASDRGYTMVRDRIADVLADLQESLSGIRVLVAHNRRRHNVDSHGNIVGEYRDANRYTARVGAVYGPATETVGVLAQAMILAIGGGCLMPPLQAAIIDLPPVNLIFMELSSIRASFFLPLLCFAVIAFYGLWVRKHGPRSFQTVV